MCPDQGMCSTVPLLVTVWPAIFGSLKVGAEYAQAMFDLLHTLSVISSPTSQSERIFQVDRGCVCKREDQFPLIGAETVSESEFNTERHRERNINYFMTKSSPTRTQQISCDNNMEGACPLVSSLQQLFQGYFCHSWR